MRLEEARELLPLYALDALSKAERDQLEAALKAFPELERELKALQDTAAELALALPPEPLPEGLEERVIERIIPKARPARSSKPARPVSLLRWLPPVAAAAAIALLVWVGSLGAVWVQALGDPKSQLVTLVDSGGATIGRALVRPDKRALLVVNLPPPPGGKVYQAWGVGAGNPIPLNTFSRRIVLVSLPPGAQALAISEEPAGGSLSPTKILGLPKGG